MKNSLMYFLATVMLFVGGCLPAGYRSQAGGSQDESSLGQPTPTPVAPTPTPSGGMGLGLVIHPENPKYFMDRATGKPVIIADYMSLVPTERSFDYVAQVQQMQREEIRYNRVWHFLPWSGENAIWPWMRSSVGGAPMGGNRLDLDIWNPEYWTRLRDALSKATAAGITSSILVFDRCGISPGGPDRWQGNPWASDNNINRIETPAADADGAPAFYEVSTKPRLRQYQEAYMKKMVEETIEYNVIYEIENEHWRYVEPDWHQRNADFLANMMASKPAHQRRLIAYNSLDKTDRENAMNYMNIDIHNVHIGKDTDELNQYIENRWGHRKPINVDEFANGMADYAELRAQSWTIILSGGHFHIEDAHPDSQPFAVTRNIKAFLRESNWDFLRAQPNRSFAAGGYCMVQEAMEYVCYFRTGGNKRITLPAGDYAARWWDPVNKGFSISEALTGTGDPLTLKAPENRDFVLYIKRSGAVPTPNPTATPGPNPTPTPVVGKACLPEPPPLKTIALKIHNRPRPGKAVIDSTPIVCSFPGSPWYGYCQNLWEDPERGCCALRPEGDPLRSVCEARVLGVDPTDGTTSPSFTVQGSGSGYKKSDNPFLFVVEGEGTVTACSNTVPKVCNSIYVEEQ